MSNTPQLTKKYYVYELINSHTNKIFYIGKGTKNRMYYHEMVAKSGKLYNKKLQTYILELLNLNYTIRYNKIFETDDELDAYEFETNRIESIGLPNLCNLIAAYNTPRCTTLGKTYEHIMGIEKSIKIRQLRSNNMILNNPMKSKKQRDIKRELMKTDANPAKNIEARKKISTKLKGRIPWNKGLVGKYKLVAGKYTFI